VPRHNGTMASPSLTKEVVFSLASFCLFVCLFVSRIMQKNYFAGFHKIRLKGGTWIMEIVEIPLDFGVRMDHIRLELGYRTWYG